MSNSEQENDNGSLSNDNPTPEQGSGVDQTKVVPVAGGREPKIAHDREAFSAYFSRVKEHWERLHFDRLAWESGDKQAVNKSSLFIVSDKVNEVSLYKNRESDYPGLLIKFKLTDLGKVTYEVFEEELEGADYLQLNEEETSSILVEAKKYRFPSEDFIQFNEPLNNKELKDKFRNELLDKCQGHEVTTLLNALDEDRLWICTDHTGKRCNFVHEMIPFEGSNAHGKPNKRYQPWTYHEGGRWFRSRPKEGWPWFGYGEALLKHRTYIQDVREEFSKLNKLKSRIPHEEYLFKLMKIRNEKNQFHCRVMLHEGAKAAEVAAKSSEDSAHPYHEFLGEYFHLGIPGGTMALKYPGSIDWERLGAFLRMIGATEVVIAMDNDSAGKGCITKIADRIWLPTKKIEWSDRFPYSFDFGDNMNEAFPDGVIPEVQNLLKPSTYATTMQRKRDRDGNVVTDDDGNAVYETVLRQHFAEDVIRLIKGGSSNGDLWGLKSDPESIAPPESFNSLLAPLSFAKVSELAKIDSRRTDINRFGFHPGRSAGIYADGNETVLNTYKDARLKPRKGDTKIFHEFMEYLMPIKEQREYMLKIMFSKFHRPFIAFRIGILLISDVQQIGKNTLIDKIWAPMLGMKYFQIADRNDLENSYTDWICEKLIIHFPDISTKSDKNINNKIKPFITESKIQRKFRFQDTRMMENYATLVFSSNDEQAIGIDKYDERSFVPELALKRWHDEKYSELYEWINRGGLNHLAYEAVSQPPEFYLNEGSMPIKTERKEQIIDSNRPGVTVTVGKILDILKLYRESHKDDPIKRRAVLFSGDVKEYINSLPETKISYSNVKKVVEASEGSGWVYNQRKLELDGEIIDGRIEIKGKDGINRRGAFFFETDEEMKNFYKYSKVGRGATKMQIKEKEDNCVNLIISPMKLKLWHEEKFKEM